jgi:RHS repeat-associated protein
VDQDDIDLAYDDYTGSGTGGAEASRADFDGDGDVDNADIAKVTSNGGSSLPASDPKVTYPRLSSFRGRNSDGTLQIHALNPFGHQGLLQDCQFGLIYNRARYFDPRFGRFTQNDPLGYVDGLNPFESLCSQPYSHLDPMGFAIEPVPPGGSITLHRTGDIVVPSVRDIAVEGWELMQTSYRMPRVFKGLWLQGLDVSGGHFRSYFRANINEVRVEDAMISASYNWTHSKANPLTVDGSMSLDRPSAPGNSFNSSTETSTMEYEVSVGLDCIAGESVDGPYVEIRDWRIRNSDDTALTGFFNAILGENQRSFSLLFLGGTVEVAPRIEELKKETSLIQKADGTSGVKVDYRARVWWTKTGSAGLVFGFGPIPIGIGSRTAEVSRRHLAYDDIQFTAYCVCVRGKRVTFIYDPGDVTLAPGGVTLPPRGADMNEILSTVVSADASGDEYLTELINQSLYDATGVDPNNSRYRADSFLVDRNGIVPLW